MSGQQNTSPVSPQKLPNTAPPQPSTNSEPETWLNRPTLSGDSGGELRKLENLGILLRAHFLAESAANPVGGHTQAAHYTQQVDFGTDIDLGRLIDLSGGKIEITFTDRAGRSLSADAIGDELAVQDSTARARISGLPS